MRNLDIIVKEIVELSEIKSAYNHYLSSHRSLTEVENTTQIQHNRRAITQSIKELYTELLQQKTKDNKRNTLGSKAVKPKTITYSDEEKNAILHFYSDKRFRITE